MRGVRRRHGLAQHPVLGVLTSAALLAVAGCSTVAVDRVGGRQPEPQVTLTILTTHPTWELTPFVNSLQRASGGNVRLTVGESFGRGSASADLDAIGLVRNGDTDLALIPARAWHDAGVTSFDALIAPMAIDSLALEQQVLAGDLPGRMLSGVDGLGLLGLGILPGPMHRLTGITGSLVSPSDLSGARIAMSRSAVADHALRALGASVVPSPFDGASLSGDDGAEQPLNDVAGHLDSRGGRTITANVNLWPRPDVLVGNAQAMRRLSRTQLEQLRAAARDALGDSAGFVASDEAQAMGVLCRRGSVSFETATAQQLVAWRSAFASTDAWLRQSSQTARFLDQITALRSRDGHPIPADAPSCSAVSQQNDAAQSPAPGAVVQAPAQTVSRFDGVYTLDTTEKDGRRSDPNVAPENWGHWVYVFGGGRFAFTQDNDRGSCTWGYGTYRVDGAKVTWLFTDGGGLAPTGGTNRPGEEFTFTWSRYRDTMTLAAVPDAVSPDVLIVKPWHRVSDTPTASALNKRCRPPAKAMPW